MSKGRFSTYFDEQACLEEVANGNAAAFRQLFEHHHHRVYRYGLELLKSAAEAEELVQDIFTKLWVGRGALAGIQNFGAYLRIMSRNHALTSLKRIALEKQVLAGSTPLLPQLLNDTEKTVYFNETQRLLTEAIAQLPPRQREVFVLCHMQGARQAEAAEKLGISVNTLKAHLQQATASVKAYLLRHTDRFAVLICLGIYVVV